MKRGGYEDHDGGGKRQMTNGSGGHYTAPLSPEPHREASGVAGGNEWMRHISKRTGQPFWFKPSTGEKTWQDPTTLEPSSPPGTPSGAGNRGGTDSKVEYPVRHGVGNCQYFLQNGTCKFGASCKWNHPKDRKEALREQDGEGKLHRKEQPPSSASLPVRPGQPECTFYMKTGKCKYGETCR